MPNCSKLATRRVVLGVILTISIVMLAASASQAQIPDLVVTVGDTVGSPGEQNSVITVYLDNPFDTITAFELWLRIGNNAICEFQTDTVTVHDTTWWICNQYNGEDCEEWVGSDAEITYWICDSVDEFMNCVDSTQVPFDSTWEWQIVADSEDVYIHDVLVGSWDSTGTLTSGWEYVVSRSVFFGNEEIKITGVADRLNVPGTVPGIAPQQGGVLFRLLADLHVIADSLEGDDRKSPIIPDPFLEHFNFSTPDGRSLGISDSLRLDSNYYHCEDWVPPDSTSCSQWLKVGVNDPWDSLAVEIDTVAYFDYSKATLNVGSVTLLHGICGQLDNDPQSLIDIGDLTYLIAYLYLGGSPPDPPSLGNMDCDPLNLVDIGDLTWLISYLYLGGAPPCVCE